jgi:pimeloyl-ACP methyl ester carboxylesterase
MMSIPFHIQIKHDRLIRGDVFPSIHQSHGTLIICHGYKGFKDWGMFPYIAEKLSEQYDVITFNFSHNGVGENLLEFTELEKFAVNTYSRELEDLDILIEHIREGKLPFNHKILSYPLFLLGHSRGAGVILIYSFDHPNLIQGVISWNGVTDLDIFSDEEKSEMKSKGRSYVYNGRTQQQMPLDLVILEDMKEHQDRYHILERVKSAKTPIALIQGSEDSQKLRKGSSMLLEAKPSIPWIQVPKGNHTFKSVHPFQGTTAPLEEAITQSKKCLDAWTSELI